VAADLIQNHSGLVRGPSFRSPLDAVKRVRECRFGNDRILLHH
jgi:hypothetical protein